MTAHEHLNLAAICSPTANVIDVNNFIMQAALSDRVRDHVMAQTGKLARDILDLLYFTLKDIPTKHPLRRHASYLLRELAFASRNFPELLLIKRADIKVDLTVPEYSGGTGYVYKGRMGDRLVAVKEIKVVEKEQYYIYREASVWAQLSHPHLATLEGILFDHTRPQLPLLVSPWMKRGTLQTYISTDDFLKRSRRRPLAMQIAQAIAYLHSHKVYHGDIKDTNILIDDNHNAVLTDFGLSIVGDVTLGHYTATGTRGSLAWMAPERFDDKIQRRTPEMDVYAYACVCYMLCRGKIMFSPKDPKKTIDGEEVAKRVKAGKRPDELTTCFEGSPLESGYWELITLCWDPQPERRITMRNVLAYYKIDVAVVQVETVQFVTTSRVNYKPKADEKTRLPLEAGDLLHITSCTGKFWTARNSVGYVGYVSPGHLTSTRQFWATVVSLPDTHKATRGMQRLPVAVGQIVDVVAIKQGSWLVRSPEDSTIGVLEPECLIPDFSSLFAVVSVRQSAALFEYLPGARAHALPVEKGAHVDTWSCSPSDLWRAARYKQRDGTFRYGVVPSHYLEDRLKRPRLLVDPIAVSLSSKKDKTKTNKHIDVDIKSSKKNKFW